jgi:hypothetical protein
MAEHRPSVATDGAKNNKGGFWRLARFAVGSAPYARRRSLRNLPSEGGFICALMDKIGMHFPEIIGKGLQPAFGYVKIWIEFPPCAVRKELLRMKKSIVRAFP